MTGPAAATVKAERRLSTIAGAAGTATSNLRFPATCTRSAGAPISSKRRASSSVCAGEINSPYAESREQMPSRSSRRYPGHDRSEIRALTTARRAPRLRASRRKFGQNSVSAITIQSQFERRQIGPDGKSKIHWKVKDVFLAESLLCQLLARRRRGRNHDSVLRESLSQLSATSSLIASTSIPPGKPRGPRSALVSRAHATAMGLFPAALSTPRDISGAASFPTSNTAG